MDLVYYLVSTYTLGGEDLNKNLKPSLRAEQYSDTRADGEVWRGIIEQ